MPDNQFRLFQSCNKIRSQFTGQSFGVFDADTSYQVCSIVYFGLYTQKLPVYDSSVSNLLTILY